MSKASADRPESARSLIEAYELALGQKLLNGDAFASSQDSAVSSLHELVFYDPRDAIDQFEASMPEQMAAMKLRGFVDGVGGQVAESDAGVIKVRLPRIFEVAVKSGLWSWFGAKMQEQIDWVGLELHMAKKQAGTRSLVDITVVRPAVSEETGAQAQCRGQFCAQICRELRAYLMVGH